MQTAAPMSSPCTRGCRAACRPPTTRPAGGRHSRISRRSSRQARNTRRDSRVHALLFEVQLALKEAEHVVVDRALRSQTEHRFSLRVQHVPAYLAMLDELAVRLGARSLALALDVFRAVRV